MTLILKGRGIAKPIYLIYKRFTSGDIIEAIITEGDVIGYDEVERQVQQELLEQEQGLWIFKIKWILY